MFFRHLEFLKDIFIIAVTAFGGPQAHLAMILNKLVNQKQYIKEQDLLELIALCQILPGPSSTQIITAIGLKKGGKLLAFVTLLFWMLPAVIIMTTIVLLFSYIEEAGLSFDFIRFLKPMAIGFVLYAAIHITRTIIKTRVQSLIIVGATLLTIFLRTPVIYPLALLAGGLITNFTGQAPAHQKKKPFEIRWTYLTAFFAILALAAILGAITNFKPVILFENTYRYGSIVFGGGHVLIPMMYEQFVNFKDYLTSEEFLAGYGMVQALPGPVFSFSTYVGGMALKDMGTTGHIIGALIGTVGIFLPGTLLIFFVTPIWESLKQYPFIQRSLEGVNAVAAGMVAAAAFLLMQSIGFDFLNIGVAIGTFLLLMFTRIPSPAIVVFCLLLGFLF
jgi:chromate transporter